MSHLWGFDRALIHQRNMLLGHTCFTAHKHALSAFTNFMLLLIHESVHPGADWPSLQNGRPSSGRRPGWFIIKEKVSD